MSAPNPIAEREEVFVEAVQFYRTLVENDGYSRGAAYEITLANFPGRILDDDQLERFDEEIKSL